MLTRPRQHQNQPTAKRCGGSRLIFLARCAVSSGYLNATDIACLYDRRTAYDPGDVLQFQTVLMISPAFCLIGANQARFSQTRVGWTVGGGQNGCFGRNGAPRSNISSTISAAAYPVAITTD
jgi:hypothetical protein